MPNYITRKIRLFVRSWTLGANLKSKLGIAFINAKWMFPAYAGGAKSRLEYLMKGRGQPFIATIRDFGSDWIIFREIFFYGDYSILESLTWEPSVVYDVGSNAGIAALYIHSLFPNARIFGFEPGIPEFENSNINYTRNFFGKVFPVALGNNTGTDFFYASEAMSGGQGFSPTEELRQTATPVEVEIWKLDDFAIHKNLPPPDLIKMDIEGHEVLALLGMTRALSACRGIILETHGPDLHRDVLKLLIESGFNIRVDSDRFAGFRILFAERDIPHVDV